MKVSKYLCDKCGEEMKVGIRHGEIKLCKMDNDRRSYSEKLPESEYCSVSCFINTLNDIAVTTLQKEIKHDND